MCNQSIMSTTPRNIGSTCSPSLNREDHQPGIFVCLLMPTRWNRTRSNTFLLFFSFPPRDGVVIGTRIGAYLHPIYRTWWFVTTEWSTGYPLSYHVQYEIWSLIRIRFIYQVGPDSWKDSRTNNGTSRKVLGNETQWRVCVYREDRGKQQESKIWSCYLLTLNLCAVPHRGWIWIPWASIKSVGHPYLGFSTFHKRT